MHNKAPEIGSMSCEGTCPRPVCKNVQAMLGAFSKSQKCLGFDSWQQPTKISLDSVLKLPVDWGANGGVTTNDPVFSMFTVYF